MNSEEDEWLDIVNEQDVVVDKKRRSEVYASDTSHFRVINAFIVNSEGKLWIPRRASDKRLFPACLDVSVGGHVESGETYDEAFKRESKEEVNIDIVDVAYTVLGVLTPHRDHVSAFMRVYEIKSDVEPDYNKKDFTESFWLTPAEFFERFKQGERVKGDLPLLIRAFYYRR